MIIYNIFFKKNKKIYINNDINSDLLENKIYFRINSENIFIYKSTKKQNNINKEYNIVSSYNLNYINFKNEGNFYYKKKNHFINNYIKLENSNKIVQKKKKILSNINIIVGNFIIFLKIFFFINLLTEINTKIQYSEITIKIKGKGTQKILNNYDDSWCGSKSFNSIPNQIYINNELQNYTGYTVYNLVNEINYITIKWNYSITNCNSMFYKLSNIEYIDFSKFNSSEVEDMVCMFYNCSSLKSIEFNNMNTSNVKNMGAMFHGCVELTSLYLNSFDTSKTTYMNYMFCNCKKLTHLNLSSFYIPSGINSNMFSNINNLVYCANPTMESVIKNIISSMAIMNCSQICFDNNKYYCYEDKCIENYNKLIKERNVCINKCINDYYYIYEYKNICYHECPSNTTVNNATYLCEELNYSIEYSNSSNLEETTNINTIMQINETNINESISLEVEITNKNTIIQNNEININETIYLEQITNKKADIQINDSNIYEITNLEEEITNKNIEIQINETIYLEQELTDKITEFQKKKNSS